MYIALREQYGIDKKNYPPEIMKFVSKLKEKINSEIMDMTAELIDSYGLQYF